MINIISIKQPVFKHNNFSRDVSIDNIHTECYHKSCKGTDTIIMQLTRQIENGQPIGSLGTKEYWEEKINLIRSWKGKF